MGHKKEKGTIFMYRHKSFIRLEIFFILIALIIVVSGAYAAHAPAPTVSIINPKPGTATSPTIVSLRSDTNDFKVQVQVWNDVAWNSVTDYVKCGYCLDISPGSVNPETCTFT